MTLPGDMPPPSLPGQIIFLWQLRIGGVGEGNVLEFQEQYAHAKLKVKP